MKELIALIKLHCEAGTILEHMELFDELEELHNDYMVYSTYIKGGMIHITVDVEPVSFEGIIK